MSCRLLGVEMVHWNRTRFTSSACDGKYVHLAQGLSSGPVSRARGAMDELAAAVAVRKFTIDGFAGQHVGQRCICGTVAGKHSRRLLQSAKAENKENNGGHAAVAYPEDAAVRVSNAPPGLLFSR